MELLANMIGNLSFAILMLLSNYSSGGFYFYVSIAQIVASLILSFTLTVKLSYALFNSFYSFNNYPGLTPIPYKFKSFLDFIGSNFNIDLFGLFVFSE